jgi:hypothetical protein
VVVILQAVKIVCRLGYLSCTSVTWQGQARDLIVCLLLDCKLQENKNFGWGHGSSDRVTV